MSPHILIVDDDPAIRSTISDVLAEEGYTVATATNGAEGLVALAGTLPAVVLLDMRMPVLDGWGFARALKERGVSLPIVVMTAAQDARQWSQEIGAAWVLAKPFDLDELLQAVERALPGRPTV
jgi:CheY-like chemotaxis protein